MKLLPVSSPLTSTNLPRAAVALIASDVVIAEPWLAFAVALDSAIVPEYSAAVLFLEVILNEFVPLKLEPFTVAEVAFTCVVKSTVRLAPLSTKIVVILLTLIDLFREFSSTSSREKYSPSSRILYYTLLWCWNEQRRPEFAAMTMQELCTLTGLPRTTIQSAFGYLADRGWVKRAKSRNRQVFGWLMRDCRQTVGKPAGFRMSPAQSKSDRSVEETPKGVSSEAPVKDSEVRANVRERIEPSDAGTVEGTGSVAAETSGQNSTNAEVYRAVGGIVVPDFSD